ncbi:MAG: diguanylate cyclase, partial [Anaerolineae bacterium]|nr:diguanylate cyclase [Anaerolineae bacterium]
WIVFALVLLMTTVVALFMAVLLARRPHTPGLRSLIIMLSLLAVWTFSYAMITLVPSLEEKKFWLRIENLGILLVPVTWFLFTVRFTKQDKWLNPFTAALFYIIPFITLVFVFSDEWFHLYYSAIRPVSPIGGPLIIERGPWYLYSTIHAYALNLAAMGLLIWSAFQFRSLYRQQMLALVGAVLIPVLANIFYQLAPRINPDLSIQIDLTPVSFTLTAALIAFGVFGLRLFDLIPIARYTVLEHIPEMVFVMDAYDRVLDANPTAQKRLGKSMDEIIGRDALEVFRAWPQLLNRFLTSDDVREEIQIPGSPPHTLEVVISPLYNQFNRLEGRVIVAHDITDHKRLEDSLQYANRELKNQLDEIEKLRAELQEQAIRDPLTNVYNRRFMAEFLDNEIAQSERKRTPVSVVIMDMDNFKQFNDTYGHKCGDVILQAFANFLVERTRRGDIVCRYGGEEFVIIMPNASLEVGHERAETWRQDFSEAATEYEGMKLCATFSAGVAAFPEHGTSGDSILQAADKALYRSKNSGRNRVTAFTR